MEASSTSFHFHSASFALTASFPRSTLPKGELKIVGCSAQSMNLASGGNIRQNLMGCIKDAHDQVGASQVPINFASFGVSELVFRPCKPGLAKCIVHPSRGAQFPDCV